MVAAALLMHNTLGYIVRTVASVAHLNVFCFWRKRYRAIKASLPRPGEVLLQTRPPDREAALMDNLVVP